MLDKKKMSAHKIRSACQPFLIIVRGRMLVLRANAKKVFLTNCPPWWLALYGYLQFSLEEKLVAPLIATPNVDKAIEDKKIGKKATLQATRVIHACRKESLFVFGNKLDKVLVQITPVV